MQYIEPQYAVPKQGRDSYINISSPYTYAPLDPSKQYYRLPYRLSCSVARTGEIGVGISTHDNVGTVSEPGIVKHISLAYVTDANFTGFIRLRLDMLTPGGGNIGSWNLVFQATGPFAKEINVPLDIPVTPGTYFEVDRFGDNITGSNSRVMCQVIVQRYL